MSHQLVDSIVVTQYLSEQCKKYWEDQFSTVERVSRFQKKPIKQPEQGIECNQYCTNIVCLVIFLLILLIFIGVSGMFMGAIKTSQSQSNILIGMAFGPCGFTLLFPLIFMLVTICSEKCSRCFVYTCTILTNLILIALSFLLYSQDQKIAQNNNEKISMRSSPAFFVLSFIYSMTVCFSYKQLSKGTKMLKIIITVILQVKSSNGLALLMLLFNMVLGILWFFGFYGIYCQYEYKQQTDTNFPGYCVLWALFFIFLLLFTHNLSTYLSARIFGFWFYSDELNKEQEQSPLRNSLKYMFFNLGTIADHIFIYPLVVLIRVLYFVLNISELQCCCGCLKSLIKCLNESLNIEIRQILYSDYLIIISGLTGISYRQSMDVLGHMSNRTDQTDKRYQNQDGRLFYLKKSISGFKTVHQSSYLFRFVLVFFVSSSITLVSVVLITVFSSGLVDFLVAGSLVIFFTSFMMTNSFFQVYINSLTTFYLIYRLDTKVASSLKSKNLKVQWYEIRLKECKRDFDDTFSGVIPQLPKVTTLKYEKKEAQSLLKKENANQSEQMQQNVNQNQSNHQGKNQNIQMEN